MLNKRASITLLLGFLLALNLGSVRPPIEQLPEVPTATVERARVPVVWLGTGNEGDFFRPNLRDLISLQQFTDVTNQPVENIPSSPPGYSIEVLVDSTWVDWLFANANYGPGSLLWVENVDPQGQHRRGQFQIPNEAQFGLTRAYLAKLGMNGSQVNEAIGTGVNGRTWAQIADQLRDWQFLRPQGGGLRPKPGTPVWVDRGQGPQLEYAR